MIYAHVRTIIIGRITRLARSSVSSFVCPVQVLYSKTKKLRKALISVNVFSAAVTDVLIFSLKGQRSSA